MATNKIGGKIWHNGRLIPWDDAKIHVMAHVVHYGSSLFEGIRCYKTQRGPEVFRLDSHVERLANSCKIYRTEIPHSREELIEGCLETIRVNSLEECYIRPIVLRGYGDFGVNPLKCPVETYIAVWEWGRYLGAEAIEKGVDVCVSTWTRMAPNTYPAMAKAGGHYMNSQLIRLEAITNGYSEGIALDVNGFISEGSGENVFLAHHGVLYTPPLVSSILPGITRDSVIRLATDLGLTVQERMLPREMLYTADEAFFAGTAVEITPIRSVDKIPVGSGSRGPITARIQKEFFAYVEGRKDDIYKWFTAVYAPGVRSTKPKEAVRA
ncbi:MAG: branched chain amino acid aminotransferase [Acidobacteria bacterium]|nr:MAG: branched chain amino acid aminotransferase [Acidobacteriota bacterium]PYV02493.1 MAG: branched chain amino acid aminotransferase [Acidobacteriota bacterium]PYV39707.1 MAG: branched chain amino acid aminotransferase [Acidobacteriota bacterium]